MSREASNPVTPTGRRALQVEGKPPATGRTGQQSYRFCCPAGPPGRPRGAGRRPEGRNRAAGRGDRPTVEPCHGLQEPATRTSGSALPHRPSNPVTLGRQRPRQTRSGRRRNRRTHRASNPVTPEDQRVRQQRRASARPAGRARQCLARQCRHAYDIARAKRRGVPDNGRLKASRRCSKPCLTALPRTTSKRSARCWEPASSQPTASPSPARW